MREVIQIRRGAYIYRESNKVEKEHGILAVALSSLSMVKAIYIHLVRSWVSKGLISKRTE